MLLHTDNKSESSGSNPKTNSRSHRGPLYELTDFPVADELQSITLEEPLRTRYPSSTRSESAERELNAAIWASDDLGISSLVWTSKPLVFGMLSNREASAVPRSMFITKPLLQNHKPIGRSEEHDEEYSPVSLQDDVSQLPGEFFEFQFSPSQRIAAAKVSGLQSSRSCRLKNQPAESPRTSRVIFAMSKPFVNAPPFDASRTAFLRAAVNSTLAENVCLRPLWTTVNRW